MSGMKDHRDLILGETYEIPVTININGSTNLTSGEVILIFNDLSHENDGTSAYRFVKRSSTDTDWITVTSATAGTVTITVAIEPTSIPSTGASYTVSGWVQFSGSPNVNHRFGSATWTFKVGEEGSLLSPLP